MGGSMAFGVVFDGVNDIVMGVDFRSIFGERLEFRLDTRANFSKPIYLFGENWSHKRSFLTLDLVNDNVAFHLNGTYDNAKIIFTLNGAQNISDKFSTVSMRRDNSGNVNLYQDDVIIAAPIVGKDYLTVVFSLPKIGRVGGDYTDSVIDKIEFYADVGGADLVWAALFDEGFGVSSVDSLNNTLSFSGMPTDGSQWHEIIEVSPSQTLTAIASEISQTINVSNSNVDLSQALSTTPVAQFNQLSALPLTLEQSLAATTISQKTEVSQSDFHQGFLFSGNEIHQDTNLSPANVTAGSDLRSAGIKSTQYISKASVSANSDLSTIGIKSTQYISKASITTGALETIDFNNVVLYSTTTQYRLRSTTTQFILKRG